MEMEAEYESEMETEVQSAMVTGKESEMVIEGGISERLN